ncbi:ADP-ribose pyrophosphatase, mitochondrial isoform X2 [Diorhabda carinulata]|uniref:ADP-ribose pyrophosphatase, mitochondrial isoform X2 n=2 Tax=Diorhabda carinulata TaxID=1163345 RepID=UPI0025A13B50|nr:ADP-ribose pyrophosphatase, mitochondrial isoform X2 [Diorhabda carinulata]
MKWYIIFMLIGFKESMLLKRMVHTKCRGVLYPFSDVKRLQIKDEQVHWSVCVSDYDPPEYNSKALVNKPWADPPIEDKSFKPKWNELDGDINRKSHTGTYRIVNGRPLNPEGRTGIKGRGILGKWGPNHAADPIVTRWKMEGNKKVISNTTNLPILQFCAIQRHDCKQWAIPGGMVDAGEKVSETVQREFREEALNNLQVSKEQAEADEKMIRNFFKNGVVIYEGYVDDPRNTDNAWMETVAYNFHDEDGSHVGKLNLTAGDDAQNIQWMDIDQNIDLYASHSNFIKAVVERLKSHW